MKNYRFRYGDGFVDVPVCEDDVAAELAGSYTEPLTDIKEALFRSLDEPVDSLPLYKLASKGTGTVIIVSDITRYWMRQDLVIPYITEYLEERCGLLPEDITILVANGTHEGGDENTLRMIVSDPVYERYTVVNHDSVNSPLTYMGTTSFDTPVYLNSLAAEADLVIALGACAHHVMAGFGGGRKSILPGISGRGTIMHNHAYSLDPVQFKSNPLIGNGRLKGNPLNEDMCESALMLPHSFMINLICNTDMEISSFISGHIISSWEKGCEEIDRIYKVPIKEKADVIITSCGGYPKDESMYQGTKGIDNSISGLNEGGTLILIMEARNGGGPDDYFGWLKYVGSPDFEKELRGNFTVAGYIFFLNCEQAKRFNIFLYTEIPPEDTLPMGIHAFSDMTELLKAADIAGKKTFIIENASTVVPYVTG